MEHANITVTWEMSEERFRQVIAERTDIENADAFWREHRDALEHHFEKGIEIVLEQDAEMLMHNAIDAVQPFKPERARTEVIAQAG